VPGVGRGLPRKERTGLRKPDIDDIRESPALDVIGLLQKKGALVEYHDPYIPRLHTHDGLEMHSVVVQWKQFAPRIAWSL